MTTGLKGHWGLGTPAKGGSDEQANKLRGAFKSAVGPIGGALQWTATNAQQSGHALQTTARDALYEQYQSVLSAIDPADPAKAAGPIADLLSRVKQIGGAVNDFKDDVKKQLDEWTGLAGTVEEVTKKIGELEEWGEAEVGKLLAFVKRMQDAAANRAWDVAKQTLEELQEALQPIYDAFVEQREAKKKYDKDRPKFEGDIETIKKAVGKLPGEVMKLLGDATKGLADAGKKAGDKDFVGGLVGLGGLGDGLKKLQEMMAQMEKDRVAYEKRLGRIEPDFKLMDESGIENEELLAKQTSMKTRRTTMKTAATAQDFHTALAEANSIQSEIAAYKTAKAQVDKQKTDFDKRKAKVEPGIKDVRKHAVNPKTEVTNARLTELRNEIVTKADALQGHEDNQNWGRGIVEADAIAVQIAAYETALADHQAEKTEYEALLAKVAPRLKVIAPPVKNKALRKAQLDFDTDMTRIEGFAKAGDYDNALTQLESVDSRSVQMEQRLAKYKAELKKCSSRLEKLKTPLREAGEPVHKALQHLQSEVLSGEKKSRTAIADEEPGKAASMLDWLEPSLKSFTEARRAMADAEAEYKKRAPGADKKAGQVVGYARKYKNERFNNLKGWAADGPGAHAALAGKGEYENALASLFATSALVDEFETLRKRLEKLEEDYDTRHEGMKGSMDDVAATKTKKASLLKCMSLVAESRGEAETAAKDGDHELALGRLDFTATRLTAWDKVLANLEQEKADYEGRVERMDGKLEKVAEDVPGKEIEAARAEITRLLGEAKAIAESDQDYDKALVKLDTVDVEVAKCLALIKAQNQRIADYGKREPRVTTSVNDMEACDHPDAETQRSKIRGLHAGMGTSRKAGEVAAALATMNTIQAELSAYAAIVARAKADAAGGDGAQKSAGTPKKTPQEKKQAKKKPASGGFGSQSGGATGGPQGGSNESTEPDSSQTSGSNPFDQQQPPQNPFG